MNKEYRATVNAINAEGWFTLWKVGKWLIVLLVILVPLGWLLMSSGIVSMNIQREIVQHSQQYVETKVNLLNKLHNDYLRLQVDIDKYRGTPAAQSSIALQKNTLQRIRTEAGMIPESQWPSGVAELLSNNNWRTP